MVQGRVEDLHPGTGISPSVVEAGILDRLAAVVLLSGSVRPTRLSGSLGLALPELPVDDQQTVLDVWRQQVNGLAHHLHRTSLPVRVVFDRATLLPAPPSGNGHAAFQMESDPRDYRGTGGVLRDIAAQYKPSDYLLAGNGAQLMMRSLAEVAEALASLEADVAVVSHRDGTPTGIMLLRCGALAAIPATGFVDMKEQALPRIAQQFRVKVAHFQTATALPTRTLTQYIHALRLFHQQRADPTAVHDPFAENIEPTFSIVQKGADVDATARIHDSVVMSGARVEAGAILVRSLVCRGAVIRRNQHVVDRLVAGSGPAAGGRN